MYLLGSVTSISYTHDFGFSVPFILRMPFPNEAIMGSSTNIEHGILTYFR